LCACARHKSRLASQTVIEFQDDPGPLILASRAKHFAALRRSDDGQAIARLEAAYEALTGALPPPLVWDEPAALAASGAVPATATAAPADVGEQRFVLPRAKKRSVRWKAQTLLDEGDRVWTYDEILAEWERRSDPIAVADPRAALRTALWGMVNAGVAVKVNNGDYRSSKFAATTEEVP
jgi:hypothetical protein